MGLWFREMVAREKSRTLACSPKPMVSEVKCLRGQHHRYAIHVHLLDNLCWASNTCENERAKRPKLERAKRPEKKLAKRPLYLPDEPQPRTYSSFGIQRQLASVTKASDKRQIETERAQNAASVGSQEGRRNSPSLHTDHAAGLHEKSLQSSSKRLCSRQPKVAGAENDAIRRGDGEPLPQNRQKLPRAEDASSAKQL